MAAVIARLLAGVRQESDQSGGGQGSKTSSRTRSWQSFKGHAQACGEGRVSSPRSIAAGRLRRPPVA